jgi:hypothetical protein
MISFTRYLYITDEVKLALLLSILEKKEESIFWAYELYYSTNKSNEIFDFLWIIYCDFFAILNPTYELYMMTKLKTFKKNKMDNEILVSMFVQNLLIRSFNTDAFILKHLQKHLLNINKNKNNNPKTDPSLFKLWVNKKDYRNISYFILSNKNKSNNIIIYNLFLEAFNIDNKKKQAGLQYLKIINYYDRDNLNANYLLLIKILNLFHEQEVKQGKVNENKKNKTFYVHVKPEDILMYNLDYDVKPYRILNLACIYPINNSNYFPLFSLQRDQITYSKLKELYQNHNDWLFYASFSPIWETRLESINANIDLNNKKIIFPNDEIE